MLGFRPVDDILVERGAGWRACREQEVEGMLELLMLFSPGEEIRDD